MHRQRTDAQHRRGEKEGVIRKKRDGFYSRAFFGQQMGETVAWAAECERES